MRTLDPKKKKRIRDSALQLFYQYGIENVSMARIARQAGIAKGTVYLYFPSRQTLLEELFVYCRDRCVEASDRDLDGEKSACGKLKRRVRNMILWQREHPEEAWMQGAFNIAPGRYRSNYERMKPHYEAEEKIVTAGVRSGELKNLPVDLLCEMLFSAVGGVLRYLVLHPEAMENEEDFDAVLDVMLDGIIARDKSGESRL